MTINVQVVARPDESIEKLLRRFVRKCKREEITREYSERMHFKSKKEKRKYKRSRSQRQEQKIIKNNQ